MPPEPVSVTELVDRGAVGRSRLTGALVLVSAVLLVLVGSVAFDRGVVGQPTALPLPSPPPVGSCLLLSPAAVVLVSCGDPHHAEVVQTWPAGTLPPGIVSFASIAAFPFGSGGRVSTPGCTEARQGWVREPGIPGTDRWTAASPVVDSQLLAAPPGERAGALGWSACIVVAPDRAPLAGSLAAAASAAPPSRLASCLRVADGRSPVTLTCDQPHRIEVIGSFRIRSVFDADGHFTGFVDDATLTSSCTALAGAVMRTADPTAGGRLAVRATSYFPGAIWEVDATDPAGTPVNTYIPLPQCAVELIGDGTLTGTVVGLGDSPLPLG